MVNRHQQAYEKKFIKHGFKVLHSETFNNRIVEKSNTIEPCHIWILETKQQTRALEQSEQSMLELHSESGCDNQSHKDSEIFGDYHPA